MPKEKGNEKVSIEMRKKFGEGIVSERFIETGEPILVRSQDIDREKKAKRHSIDGANNQKFRPKKPKRKGPEYKIIFE